MSGKLVNSENVFSINRLGIRLWLWKAYFTQALWDRGLNTEISRGSLANLAAKGYLLISTVRERSDGRDYSRGSQAAGRPALWPPARWRHGRGGRARRSSLPGRFRAPLLEGKAPGDGETHREHVWGRCSGRGARERCGHARRRKFFRRDPEHTV